ncbi:peptidoglycan-binding protein [Streptomyces sp. SD15]
MSTPSEPGQPVRRRALEPTYVERRRRTEALAELLRQVREEEKGADPDENYESIPLPLTGTKDLPPAEDATEELPPVLVGEDYTGRGSFVRAGQPEPDPGFDRGREVGHGRGRGAGLRRAVIVGAVTTAALGGFALALLLPGGGSDGGSQAGQAGTGPAATAAAQAPSPAADPDGAGTLREGASGSEVTELQQRLLDIPDVYTDGSTSGTYDATLTAAVARFQLWYGIRGDETGVYGNDTRAALESRTTL